ncbi:hypothetical protein GCM10025856_01800 [Methylophaga marina]|uniref:Uncharacterized protein n=1 Tax=Methylophaga marina TaxID=45495 RepID=A0ABN0TCK0_9GAMM|nr:hypothetical protein GCM10025856_01800 [Methylophaga marina]
MLNQPALAQNNLSKKPVIPDSIVGKYLIYKSGSVTSFAQKKTWLITYKDEFYVYSRKGTSGTSARETYNCRVMLTMSDKR